MFIILINSMCSYMYMCTPNAYMFTFGKRHNVYMPMLNLNYNVD